MGLVASPGFAARGHETRTQKRRGRGTEDVAKVGNRDRVLALIRQLRALEVSCAPSVDSGAEFQSKTIFVVVSIIISVIRLSLPISHVLKAMGRSNRLCAGPN